MQSLKTEIGAVLRDGEGNIIRRIPFRKCHSLLKAFVQLLAIQVSQSTRTIKDIYGASNSHREDSWCFKTTVYQATSGSIVIGSGVKVVEIDDYALETQLTTNIYHNSPSFAEEKPDSATWRLALSRGFVNNTGSTVDVKEVGLYVYHGDTFRVCIDRTLYEVSFAVGETLTLTYRLTVNV